MKWKSWIRDGIILFVLIIGISYWQVRNLLPTNHVVPPIPTKTLTNKDIEIDPNRKKILYFFAPWCTVCKLNIDNLNDIASMESWQVIAIGLAYESPQDLEKYAKKLEVPVVIGTEQDGANFKIEGFPTVYFLSKDNKIRFRSVGYITTVGLWLRMLFT